jgi:hypothetical protein
MDEKRTSRGPAMLEKVISGGQTGADQAALRAARAAGIPTGGWAPNQWLVESDGRKNLPAPWLADYGLVEAPEPGHPAQTRANVRDSDGSLWFGDYMTRGWVVTINACRELNKPFMVAYPGTIPPEQVVEWIAKKGIRTLNVAGNLETNTPGIGERTERFLAVVFKRLAEEGMVSTGER